MSNKLLVFDLETIVDVDVCSSVFGCSCRDVGMCDSAVRHYHLSVNNNPFPRQCFHRVIAVGCALFDITFHKDGTESYRFIRSGCMSGEEKVILADFFKFIDQNRPRLVSYNGRGFDVPVLRYRAMKYELGCSIFRSDITRYSIARHCDLLDVLSDFGASSKNMKLHEACSLIGVPGKFGVGGADILAMYLANETEAIRDYCETDVLSTYLLYLRYMLHSQNITYENYRNATEEIREYLRNTSKLRHKEFYNLWIQADNVV